MSRSVDGTTTERKPESAEELLGQLLGSPLVKWDKGQRAIWGGHTLFGILRAAIELGVDPERDLVSIESNISQGGSGFYVVEQHAGVREMREV